MPFVKLQTNIELNDSTHKQLRKQLSSLTASQLGKPESYVMISIEASCSMLFAGNNEPLCYVEFKSIGLAESKTAAISAALCELIHESIKVNPERIYIEFTNAPRTMWGWNNTTF